MDASEFFMFGYRSYSARWASGYRSSCLTSMRLLPRGIGLRETRKVGSVFVRSLSLVIQAIYKYHSGMTHGMEIYLYSRTQRVRVASQRLRPYGSYIRV